MNKLKAFERNNSRVHFLPLALGAKNEVTTFYESQSYESGSLKKDHKNVLSDQVTKYDVQVVTLDTLIQKCGGKSVSIMKIDIEGEEYVLIDSLSKETLKQINQLIIEFHHDIIQNCSIVETKKAIKTIEKLGMKSVFYNGCDCLFYWKNT